MAAEQVSFEWLRRPELAADTLAESGLFGARQLPMRVEKAWPFQTGGWLARLQGSDGAWWALAAPDSASSLPRALASGVGGGSVRALGGRQVLVWPFASDPALAIHSCIRQGSSLAVGYKPLHRCVIRYERPADGGWIAKLYGGKRAERAAATYGGLGPSPGRVPVDIPGPEIHDRSARALHWRAAGGASLLEKLMADPQPLLMHRAAEVLGDLQHRRVSWTGQHAAGSEIATLARWVAFAARIHPGLKQPLRDALSGLASSAKRLQPAELVPCHRDFYDQQILVNGRHAVLLDMDTACLAEPELDLANFIAHLQLRELQGRFADSTALGTAFIRHYESTVRAVNHSTLAFYRSCALVRLACVYLARPQWSAIAARLLDLSHH